MIKSKFKKKNNNTGFIVQGVQNNRSPHPFVTFNYWLLQLKSRTIYQIEPSLTQSQPFPVGAQSWTRTSLCVIGWQSQCLACSIPSCVQNQPFQLLITSVSPWSHTGMKGGALGMIQPNKFNEAQAFLFLDPVGSPPQIMQKRFYASSKPWWNGELPGC